MIIDSHQHFWNYHPIKDAWIDEDMSVLKRNFLPEDLLPLLHSNNVNGCIAVQADQSTDESRFLLKLAEENEFIKGVVGWVDLCSKDIEAQIEEFADHKMLVGIRHILQAEEKGFMLTDSFYNGISSLRQYDLTYDILVFPHQLKEVIQLVGHFPDQPFVINHMAKPYIKKGEIDDWKRDISTISRFENVWCKISGMVTEADLKQWKEDDFTPYLDVIFETFGTDRIMYGSDWPVCLLAAEYDEQKSIIDNYISQFSKEEYMSIMGSNASNFYHL
ncbi:MAG: amidohydrolase family protein [Saprospiraceae bacterium]|nr:amidohydrolase family protein [Saprospiraceae bacterium]